MRKTLLSRTRIRKVQSIALDVAKQKIPGCYVECGVWRGGSAAVVARAFRDMYDLRDLFLLDSFEGMPMPTGADRHGDGRWAGDMPNNGMPDNEGIDPLVVCKNALKETHYPQGKVHIVKGWFDVTVPAIFTGPIAFLHVDCDFYDSVKIVLENFWPQVVDGGFVVIDDYGCWKGCKKAVDEVLPKVKWEKTDWTGVWTQKKGRE